MFKDEFQIAMLIIVFFLFYSLGVENFTREIIHLCPNKGTANYLEAKEQFTRSVLENKDLWYNSWISVKVMRSHVRLS